MSAQNVHLTDELKKYESLKMKYEHVCSEVERITKDNNDITTQAETNAHELQLQIDNLSAIHDCVKVGIIMINWSKLNSFLSFDFPPSFMLPYFVFLLHCL